jgi:hypothetical protein
MESAPKIPSPGDKKENKKKPETDEKTIRQAANLLGVVVGSAIAAASPVQKAAKALETVQKVEMTGPIRARDFEPLVAKYETEKLVMEAPTPEQMAKVLESKKENQ